MKKLLGIILGFISFTVSFKIVAVLIIIIGAMIFGDSARVAANVDGLANVIGFFVGLFLGMKAYRHFVPKAVHEKDT